MKKVLLIVLFITANILACTTAIISGKYTADGRPLLFKHRDSDYVNNKLLRFNDGKYKFIGLVNAGENEQDEVWGGYNEVGFAIMNSASYNLNPEEYDGPADREGIVMKQALAECETVDDFEELLKEMEVPFGVEANFGVIDAKGGAAYFETSADGYKKIDVNDPAIAPFGYVIRTNYSFNGIDDSGYGYIRYRTADNLFYGKAAERKIDYRFLLEDVSRNLYNSLTETNLKDYDRFSADDRKFAPLGDYINRNSSVSSIVVRGVREEESADETMMWSVLGFPLTSIAFPVWIKDDVELPLLLTGLPNGNSMLCDFSLWLKQRCFPVTRGNGKDYILITELFNKEQKGIRQLLKPVEQNVLSMTDSLLKSHPGRDLLTSEILDFYDKLSDYIMDSYIELYGFTYETNNFVR